MAGFRKASCDQAFLKIGMHGAPGTGKTFTALLLAEGLAKSSKKRLKVAFVDTERGSSFYAKAIPRAVHPDAFEFDVLHTRSLVDALESIREIDHTAYGCIIVDSLSHLWDAAINAYCQGAGIAGEIPAYAWGEIKRPYKELVSLLLTMPLHVIFCGRETDEYENDEKTGKKKMRAEKESAHEPHLCMRLTVDHDELGQQFHLAYIEKDRTGILTGQIVTNPNFDNLCLPLLPHLGTKQGDIESESTVASRDSEKLSAMEEVRLQVSATYRDEYRGKFLMAKTAKDLDALGKELTPEVKKLMTASDLADVRDAYKKRHGILDNSVAV